MKKDCENLFCLNSKRLGNMNAIYKCIFIVKYGHSNGGKKKKPLVCPKFSINFT
jgi:hypothetical protein